jgi:hypothetical protein
MRRVAPYSLMRLFDETQTAAVATLFRADLNCI